MPTSADDATNEPAVDEQIDMVSAAMAQKTIQAAEMEAFFERLQQDQKSPTNMVSTDNNLYSYKIIMICTKMYSNPRFCCPNFGVSEGFSTRLDIIDPVRMLSPV